LWGCVYPEKGPRDIMNQRCPGDTAALAYKEVVREPVVREADETRG